MIAEIYLVLAVPALILLLAGSLAQLVELVTGSRHARRAAQALLMPGAVTCLGALALALAAVFSRSAPAAMILKFQVAFLAPAGLLAAAALIVGVFEPRARAGLAPVRAFLHLLSGMFAAGATLYVLAGPGPAQPPKPASGRDPAPTRHHGDAPNSGLPAADACTVPVAPQESACEPLPRQQIP